MTDEVFSDNLDEAPEADLEAVAAVEALPAEGESVQETADETVEAEPTTEVASDESEEGEEDDEQDAGAKAVEDFSNSLRTLEGKWYVLHTYSGYEKRVKTNVESRVASFGMEDKIFQIEVPMEEVEKHTEKGKKVITRVRVPGYVLIRMLPDENARRIVRETEGVTGFVGPTKEPAPLSRKEVVSMMAPMIASEALKKAGDKPAANKKRVLEVSYAVGDPDIRIFRIGVQAFPLCPLPQTKKTPQCAGSFKKSYQDSFSTWLKPNSTGVSRPKMDTSTVSFWVVGSTSETTAAMVVNGPSVTVT